MSPSLERGLKSRQVTLAFLATFGITVIGLVLTALLLRERALKIRDVADAITKNAVPSIEHLTSIRTTLRHIELTLDDFADRSALTGAAIPEPPGVEAERASLRRAWGAYTSLPMFPGERTLQPGLARGLSELDSLISRLLFDTREGDRTRARDDFEREVKPFFDEIDERLNEAEELNANGSAEAAATVESVQEAMQLLSAILSVSCALLGVIAAIVAVRLWTQYQRATDQQIAELELFAGRVAHDIRGPLSSVGLAIAVAERTGGKDPEVLRRANRSIQRIAQLVEGLLLLAQVVRSPQTDESAVVRDVLADVIEEFKPWAVAQNIQLELGAAVDAAVACSAGVLSNMTSNLIGNAIKYMGDSPVRRVTVRASTANHLVRIEVDDTGPGIPAGAQTRVFDPHERAASANVAGLGLGLATVRRLAEVLGGRAGLASTEGVGTLLWFEVPNTGGGRPIPLGDGASASAKT